MHALWVSFTVWYIYVLSQNSKTCPFIFHVKIHIYIYIYIYAYGYIRKCVEFSWILQNKNFWKIRYHILNCLTASASTTFYELRVCVFSNILSFSKHLQQIRATNSFWRQIKCFRKQKYNCLCTVIIIFQTSCFLLVLPSGAAKNCWGCELPHVY